MDNKLILLVDSRHGQYIPMLFAQCAVENLFAFKIENIGELNEQLQALAKENSNESFEYWDLFVEVEYRLIARFDDDERDWRITWIDGDLYLASDDVEFDDEGYPTHWE